MQRKNQSERAVFAQAFSELKAEGFYDDFARILRLKLKPIPETACRIKTTAGKRKPVKKNQAPDAKRVRLLADR